MGGKPNFSLYGPRSGEKEEEEEENERTADGILHPTPLQLRIQLTFLKGGPSLSPLCTLGLPLRQNDPFHAFSRLQDTLGSCSIRLLTEHPCYGIR